MEDLKKPPARAFDRVFAGRLKLKHLALFRSVCELGTVRKAADASAMTQPAATKLIQELEAMCGVTLFQRDRGGMRTTLFGDVVRRHVDILLADIDNLRADVDMLASGMSGCIRLGVVPSLSQSLLATSVARTLALRPMLRFETQEGSTNDLLARLKRNELDLIFGRILDAEQAEGLRVIRVYAESFAIVCAAGHALSARRSVPWSELSKCRWVLPPTGTPMRQLVDGIFTRAGALHPHAAVEGSSFERMRSLIQASDLLGVVPRSMALAGKASGELVLLKPGVGDDFAPISLIARGDIDPSPIATLFAQVVLETAVSMKLS